MWKRTQSLMDHLSRNEKIHRVIFVNPEVWLTDLFSDFKEQLSPMSHKLYRYSWKSVIPTKVNSKVITVTPFNFIPLGRTIPGLGRLQGTFHHWMINRLIQGRDYILFVNDFPFNPERQQQIEELRQKAKLMMFDWSDDFVEFFQDPVGRKKVNDLCENYIRRAHGVMAVNEELTQRAKRHNPHSYTILNGTDIVSMPDSGTTGQEGPEALRSLSRPLIGYVGWITPTRIDSELIINLARTRPDWTIVLVGPSNKRFTQAFDNHPNIAFLPPVDYQILPQYLSAFDVCIIPHYVNDHTRGNNPLKLYQYLAVGKPVVSTAISGLEGFEDVVYIAKDKEEFPHRVEQALKEDSGDRRERRLEKARENSWSSRVDEVWRIIDNRLESASQEK